MALQRTMVFQWAQAFMVLSRTDASVEVVGFYRTREGANQYLDELAAKMEKEKESLEFLDKILGRKADERQVYVVIEVGGLEAFKIER